MPRQGVRGGWMGSGAGTRERPGQGNAAPLIEWGHEHPKRAATRESKTGQPQTRQEGSPHPVARGVVRIWAGEAREGSTLLIWRGDLKAGLGPTRTD